MSNDINRSTLAVGPLLPPALDLAKSGFKQASRLEWLDISDELSRTYIYPEGDEVTVPEPLRVSIKRREKGDSHRIITKGDSYYITPGWLAIRWTPRDGTAPYAF